jgi:hypothetical protein
MSSSLLLRALANELRCQTFDETPSGNGGAHDIERERGYRAGHNDATRAIARRLDEMAALDDAVAVQVRVVEVKS